MKDPRFDVGDWKRKIGESKRLVADDYPAGCLGWLKETDPGRIAALKATVEAAKAAFLRHDSKALAKALVAYERSHFGVFETFRSISGGWS